MKISSYPLNPVSSNSDKHDTVELEKLKARVERAIADGWLSRDERDGIIRRIYADHQVSVEECEILRLLQQKIWEGEIQID